MNYENMRWDMILTERPPNFTPKKGSGNRGLRDNILLKFQKSAS